MKILRFDCAILRDALAPGRPTAVQEGRSTDRNGAEGQSIIARSLQTLPPRRIIVDTAPGPDASAVRKSILVRYRADSKSNRAEQMSSKNERAVRATLEKGRTPRPAIPRAAACVCGNLRFSFLSPDEKAVSPCVSPAAARDVGAREARAGSGVTVPFDGARTSEAVGKEGVCLCRGRLRTVCSAWAGWVWRGPSGWEWGGIGLLWTVGQSGVVCVDAGGRVQGSAAPDAMRRAMRWS